MDLVSEFIVAIQPMVVKTSTFQNESVFQHFQLHTDRTSVRRARNMIKELVDPLNDARKIRQVSHT